MHRGYIKLWRKVFDGGMQKNHKLFTLWMWLLCNASHKEMKYVVGTKEITIQPGQIITGRIKLSQELGMSEKNVRTILEFLKNSGKVAIKTASKYSIITIIKWDIYQQEEKEMVHQNGQQAASKRPASGQQRATKQECKNEKNEKKEKKKENFIFPESYSENLVSKFQDFIENRKTLKKPVTGKAFIALIEKLNFLSDGNEINAIQILNNSIESGWSGLFPIKNQKGKMQNEFSKTVYTGTDTSKLSWCKNDSKDLPGPR